MCLGIPGKLIEIAVPEQDDGLPMGKVQFGGITKDICLAYLPEAAVGDYVLVHVGFAISKIDAEEAAETKEDAAVLLTVQVMRYLQNGGYRITL